MNKILDIKNLTFIADKKILSSINWEVLKGERWVVLGANGSGKTSLISTICGYITPSDGSMAVDGNVYSECEWQKVREKIALVGSQLRRQIDKSETVIETVITGAYAMINFWGKVEKNVVLKAVKKLKELKIFHLAERTWGQISQGERQKVLIARALMCNPSVIFLDEPCTGLDPVALHNFLSFLEKISLSKKIPAIILTTHHIEEIPSTFTHLMILKDGKVFDSGKIRKILTSENLSKAYGADCIVSRKNKKYSLKVKCPKK